MSRPNEEEIVGAIVLAILLIAFTAMVKFVNHSEYTKDKDPTMQLTSSSDRVLLPSNQAHNNSVLIPILNQEQSTDTTHQEIAEEESDIRALSDFTEIYMK